MSDRIYCSNCCYFQMDMKNVQSGWCRQSPPVQFAIQLPGELKLVSRSPVVQRDFRGCHHHRVSDSEENLRDGLLEGENASN